MKIKNSLYLLIVLYSLTGCSKDNFDDYNIPPKMYSSEHFEQYLLQNFDLDGDDHISIREAKSVKEIKYSNVGTISLSCLQYFTGLESLHCRNTGILDIDLTKSPNLRDITCIDTWFDSSILDLSKNTALEVLEFTNGYNVKNLDLSNNVNLRKLYLRHFGQLDVIDFKNNTELKTIYINYVYNANLDFSYNKKLEELHLSEIYSADNNRKINIENSPVKSVYCSSVSGLNSINLSGCNKLDSFYIQTLDYEKGSININFEDCSSLKYLSLINGEYIFTGINSCVKMEEINISGNVDLKEVDFSNMPELKELYCTYNNQLTSLEIKKSEKLEKLYFSEINSANAVSIILSDNRSLKEIYCDNIYNISTLNISGCENLLSIDCTNLNNGNDNVLVTIDGCSALQTLNLHRGRYSLPDISSCVKLKDISLSGSGETDLDISKNTELENVFLESGYLLAPIPNNKKIKTLHCISMKNAEIFDLSNQLLLEELYCQSYIPINIEKNKALRVLSIVDYIYVKPKQEMTSLSLKDYPQLSMVSFGSSYKLSLMEVENCPRLDNLSFSSYPDNGIDTLKIKNCETLNTLSCGSMKIKALDITACPMLEVLWCWYNDLSELDPSGAPQLKRLICTNNRLEKLDVSKNIALLELSCEYNEPMTELDLRNNKNLQSFSCGNDKNPITVYLFENYTYYKHVINGTIVYE